MPANFVTKVAILRITTDIAEEVATQVVVGAILAVDIEAIMIHNVPIIIRVAINMESDVLVDGDSLYLK